jgi:hypothetical protein
MLSVVLRAFRTLSGDFFLAPFFQNGARLFTS